MKKMDYEKSLEIVRDSIHRINPYHLMEEGFPDDEFDREISSIAKQLERCNSGKDVSHTIARVLNSAFNENHQAEEFIEEGNIIFKGLEQNGLK